MIWAYIQALYGMIQFLTVSAFPDDSTASLQMKNERPSTTQTSRLQTQGGPRSPFPITNRAAVHTLSAEEVNKASQNLHLAGQEGLSKAKERKRWSQGASEQRDRKK